MEDKLEKFVNENREAFDSETPDERVWNGVRRKLASTQGAPKGLWIWRAAAVIFFALSAFLLLKDYVFTSEPDNELTAVEQQFLETENYYTSLISLKEQELDAYQSRIDFDYMAQVGNLNAIYQVLKTELENEPSRPVIDALILNLISRVDILNRELEKLEKLKEAGMLDEQPEAQS